MAFNISNGVLISYSGDDVNIVIPPEVNRIDSMVFFAKTDIKSAVIHGGVKSIGQGAFFNCSALETVVIGSGVEVIETFAFRGCDSLKSITIPSSVTEIQPMAFDDDIEIKSGGGASPDSSTPTAPPPSPAQEHAPIHEEPVEFTIYQGILRDIKGNPEHLTVPEGVVSTACSFPEALNEITLPESLKYMGVSLFEDCSRLESIELPAGVRVINGSFQDCGSLRSVKLNQGLEAICEFSFDNCASLSEICIPDSVTYLGSAFSNCVSLRRVRLPERISAVDDCTFSGCSSLEELDIPDSVTSVGCEAFSGCSSLRRVTLPPHIDRIESGTFKGCSSLTEIVIPKTVRIIGRNAFAGCASLKMVRFEGELPSIHPTAFDGAPAGGGIKVNNNFYYDQLLLKYYRSDILLNAFVYNSLYEALALSYGNDCYFDVDSVSGNLIKGRCYGGSLSKGSEICWMYNGVFRKAAVAEIGDYSIKDQQEVFVPRSYGNSMPSGIFDCVIKADYLQEGDLRYPCILAIHKPNT